MIVESMENGDEPGHGTLVEGEERGSYHMTVLVLP